jgi:hypothetical protein
LFEDSAEVRLVAETARQRDIGEFLARLPHQALGAPDAP